MYISLFVVVYVNISTLPIHRRYTPLTAVAALSLTLEWVLKHIQTRTFVLGKLSNSRFSACGSTKVQFILYGSYTCNCRYIRWAGG